MLNCTRLLGLGSGVQRLRGEYHRPLVTAVLDRFWAGCNTHKPPFQGYDITPLLPCGLPVLGKAREVNPNRKPEAEVPRVSWQDNATPVTPATLLVPKQYRHSSFPWIHWSRGEGWLAAWTIARLPCILPRQCNSTGEDTPALLHCLM